jgi:hypothetical protein
MDECLPRQRKTKMDHPSLSTPTHLADRHEGNHIYNGVVYKGGNHYLHLSVPEDIEATEEDELMMEEPPEE